jgi:hypothetical protein
VSISAGAVPSSAQSILFAYLDPLMHDMHHELICNIAGSSSTAQAGGACAALSRGQTRPGRTSCPAVMARRAPYSPVPRRTWVGKSSPARARRAGAAILTDRCAAAAARPEGPAIQLADVALGELGHTSSCRSGQTELSRR